MLDTATAPAAPLRIGSLFSGYGGLDLAVEHVFGGRTVWFSELNPAPAHVFAHHWPGVPNLGDITQIDWRQAEPVDVLCGGFPCQDVSTVGKRAGLAPGTRSGLWAQMATAIDVLQPEWVVAENVRGLLSATARRPEPKDDPDESNPLSAALEFATPPNALPFAQWNPTRGIWETHQPDLYGHLEPYSAIWPTSGTTLAGLAYPLPTSAHPTPDFGSSSSPGALFRTPLASDVARGGETLEQVRARRGTIALSHQIIDLAQNGPRSWQGKEPAGLWPLIEQLFDGGDTTPEPSDGGNTLPDGLPPRRPS